MEIPPTPVQMGNLTLFKQQSWRQIVPVRYCPIFSTAQYFEWPFSSSQTMEAMALIEIDA